MPVFSSEVASLLDGLMKNNNGALPDGLIQKDLHGKVWTSKDDSWSEIADPGRPEGDSKCPSCNGRDCEEDCLSETEYEPFPVPHKQILVVETHPPSPVEQKLPLRNTPKIISKTCGKCGGDAGRYGNNPHPLPFETVCDQCNLYYVIPARVNAIKPL